MTVRIDAHQHLWQVARGDYGWLTRDAVPTIYRDFLADDLRPLLRDARIDKTILVQAAESIAETEFLLELAAESPFIAGVVGWVDFAASDATNQITRLARDPRLVGLRPMLQDMTDERWILKPELAVVIQSMQAHELRFDALIRPRHLPALLEFAQRYPELSIVIDHAAKPDIAAGGSDDWRAGIARLSRLRGVHCKLSGLATEAGPDWNAQRLKPCVDVLLDCFGPKRLMWGSDWPVLLLAGGYQQWLHVAEELTADLSSSERAHIFGGTAAAFYGVTNA
jgi:L-fuconolactonase